VLIRLIRSGINRTDSLNEGTGVSALSTQPSNQDVTSFDVFLFGLLIASDNSLEKGDEWTRKKNECVDEAARERRTNRAESDNRRRRLWSYFAERNFYGTPSTTSELTAGTCGIFRFNHA